MDSTAAYNYIEVGLWSLYAILSAVAAMRSAGRRRKILLIASVAFLAFAYSDWIEASTGAWWRPWWLLVLKGGCMATFVACFVVWRRIASDSRSESATLPIPCDPAEKP